MMNRWLTGATVAAALMTPLSAGAQSAGGTYIGGGIAIQDVDGYDDGSAVTLRGAKALPGVLAAGAPGVVSVEGELTRTLTSPERDLPPTSSNDTAEVDITTLGAYGVYTLPVQAARFRGRLGMVYEDIDGDGVGDDTELGLSFGIGAGLMVTRRVEVAANYTYIEDDVEHLGVNALLHF